MDRSGVFSQRLAYAAVMCSAFATSELCCLLRERLCKHFPAESNTWCNIQFDEVFKVAPGLGKHVCMSILKSLLGG
eukprot:8338064-Karenia_brevis.AAC.1